MQNLTTNNTCRIKLNFKSYQQFFIKTKTFFANLSINAFVILK